jgi:hypothetical protein
MKVINLLMFFSLLFMNTVKADSFSTFAEKTHYEVDGKFIQKEKVNYFVINFDNANEEKIQIKNSDLLTPSHRYRLCIYNLKNCHLNCLAEVN